MESNKLIVACVVCGAQMLVSEAQKKLMDKIGQTTCGPECAVKWITGDY